MGFKPRQRRVCVYWRDATCENRWHEPDNGPEEPLDMRTIGYLMGRTKTHVRVAQSMAENGLISELMLIPIGCVSRIERLGR